MSMKTIIFFIIAIVNVISYFGDDKCCKQCCEHCCEYLENFCNKEKNKEEEEENEEEEEEEKEDDENNEEEEAKVLVNVIWLNKKKNNGGSFLKIFNKDENKNEYKSGNIKIKLVKKDGKTKIIILGIK